MKRGGEQREEEEGGGGKREVLERLQLYKTHLDSAAKPRELKTKLFPL